MALFYLKKDKTFMKKKATMQDVADLAQVSVMTVSRVLNNKSLVRERTVKKVLRAIESLQFKPNTVARSLAGKKSYYIGLIYSNPSDAYASQLLFGALKSCQKYGYNIVIESLNEDLKDIDSVIKKIIGGQSIDGMICPPPICNRPKILQKFIDADIPIVRISPEQKCDKIPCVSMDEKQAAYDMTTYLINKNHRDIGFIMGHPDHGGSKLRYGGFQESMADNNIKIKDNLIQQGYFSYESGFKCAEILLAQNPRPSAIFASNDDMAVATISAAHKAGLSIPGDLSVVGFDDTVAAGITWPKLTTIHQPILEMGELAADILINHIGKPSIDGENRGHILPYHLVERGSVAAHKPKS